MKTRIYAAPAVKGLMTIRLKTEMNAAQTTILSKFQIKSNATEISMIFFDGFKFNRINEIERWILNKTT